MKRYLVWGLALAGLLVFLLPQISWGQTPATPGGGATSLKYFDFFVVKGGWIAYLIILLSVVMVALTVEYCMSIRRVTIVPPDVISKVKELFDERQYVEAIQYSTDEPSMLGGAVHQALLESSAGYAEMERAVEEFIDERSARLFRKIESLNIIGNVSPMLGLFGTVVGMILLFAEIHAAEAFPPAQVVADKVAIALITTFWGLAVAIPALSIHAIFRNRIDMLTAECALTAERLLSVFKPGKEAPPAPATHHVKPSPAKVQHAIQS